MNRQPAFDKFQLAGFRRAKHSRLKTARWALALLSGKYKQGKGYLEDAEGNFDFLGVLAKTSGMKRGLAYGYITYDDNTLIFPEQALGGKRQPQDWDDDNYPDFVKANDERGVTFKETGLWLLRSLLPW